MNKYDLDRFRLSVQYAENLRKNATPAELAVCDILDAHRISYVFQANLCDLKTGRMYIADFRIRRQPPLRPRGMPRKNWLRDNRKLFVEIDGSCHRGRELYDKHRTRWIESHRNAVVLRFTNEEVLSNPKIVLERIAPFNPVKKRNKLSKTSPNNLKARAWIAKQIQQKPSGPQPRLVKLPKSSL